MSRHNTNPVHSEKQLKMGPALHQIKDQDEAFQILRKAIQLNPSSWEAYLQLGALFHDSQALNEAIACYKKALFLNEGQFEIRFRLGMAYQDREDLQHAVEAYETAIEADPTANAVYINLGTVCQRMGQYGKALEWYKKAACRFPDNPLIHMNMGTVYASLGKNNKATRCYETAIALDPDYEKAVCYLYKQYQRNCDWEKGEALGERLDQLTQASLNWRGQPAETPFLNISRHANPALNHAVASAWSNQIEAGRLAVTQVYSHNAKSPSARVIKIGYLSNTFCNHPGAQLLHDIFSLHDREKFEVYGYSVGPDDDSRYRRSIKDGCDVFRQMGGFDSERVARQINRDRIDIYIDLMGHITNSRMDVAALRPAPVQVRYLGMAGTTGSRFFDYIITDQIVTPPDQAQFYSECFAYLPDSYQINSRRYPEVSKNYKKDDFGLSAFNFVFCSFNTSYKIEPLMFRTWMKILKRVPQSVLWLLGGNAGLESNLIHEVKKAGVDPDRIVFSEKFPKEEHLTRLQMADLILDTRIVNGAASTSDALWMGVPVLTLQGKHFASRMSSSLLAAVGMADLITQSLGEYENLAVALAVDGAMLGKIRSRLAVGRLNSPLFDTVSSVKLLEDAFLEMWRRYTSGKCPDHIWVTA